jgi:PAS domain S-box-containing protein
MREAISPKRATPLEERDGQDVPAEPQPDKVAGQEPSEPGRAVEIDQLVSMIATVGRDLRYRCVNLAYAEWTGRHRSQIEGKHLSEVLPEEVLGQIVPFIERVLEGECVRHEIAVRSPRGDASHLSFRYVPDSDGFIASITDVSAHRRVQFRLSTKNAITQSLWEARTVEEAATGVLGALCRYLGCRVSVLWLEGGDGRLHSASVVAPSEATQQIIAAGCSEIAFARGEGAVGRVWESGRPTIFADIFDVPDFRRKDLAQSEGLTGLLAFPLMLGDRVIGVLEFLFDASEEPDADVMSMLTGIASQLAQFVERVRVEEALRESEWRLMLMTDLVPQLIWSADASGRVDFYSSRHSEYAGFARDEDGRWNWTPVVHPEDIHATVAAWEAAVRTGAPYEIEHRIGAADGSFRWHLSRALPLRDGSGAVTRWYGSATDIHALKSAQAESERLLSEQQAILATMAQGLALVGRDGGISYMNPAGRRILRWDDVGSPRGSDATWMTGDPRDLEGLPLAGGARPDMRALAGERVRGQKVRVALPGGHEAILSYDGEPYKDATGALAGAIVTFEDITERQAAEQRLRDSEARLKATFEGVTDAIITFDAAGNITNFNHAFARMHGHPDKETAPTHLYYYVQDLDVRTPDGVALAVEDWPFERALRGESVKDMELHVSRRSVATPGYVGSFAAVPIRNENGDILQVVVTIRDVTERRRAQRRHDLMTRELNHRARNALAVVQAITRLTKADTVEAYGKAVRGRVEALVRSHARLADSDWSELPLWQLVRDELSPFMSDENDQVVLTGNDIRLSPVAVQPVSMALHELTVNAAKYGALSVRNGSVSRGEGPDTAQITECCMREIGLGT